jgi:antitoxin component of RelBE/YafQ-DinJ toxin-antitoxin module
MGRYVRVAFKMNEERKNDLQEFAESYGVTMSALCSLIIGQWIHNQKKLVLPIVDRVGEAIMDKVKMELEGQNRA